MSNFVSMPVKELTLHISQVRPVMQCLIHTVLFMRALGIQTPRDLELEILDISYAAIDSKELDQVIAQQIDRFIKSIPNPSASSSSKQQQKAPPTHLLNLKFSTPIQSKQESWLWNKQQKNVWESWEFKIRITEEEPNREALRKEVEQRIKLIANMAQKRTQQIPSLAEIEKMPFKCFDFEFESSSEGNSAGFLGAVGNLFGVGKK